MRGIQKNNLVLLPSVPLKHLLSKDGGADENYFAATFALESLGIFFC